MDDVIAGLLDAVFDWLVSVLPQDPFGTYLVAVQGLQRGLGWLNWMFPVHDAVVFFGLWISTVTAYVAGRRIVAGLLDVGTSITKVV